MGWKVLGSSLTNAAGPVLSDPACWGPDRGGGEGCDPQRGTACPDCPCSCRLPGKLKMGESGASGAWLGRGQCGDIFIGIRFLPSPLHAPKVLVPWPSHPPFVD